jgi:hypothetical protein
MVDRTVFLYTQIVLALQVLSVEYPLAPEQQFPAAVVDTAAAYTWLCQQLQQQGSSACVIPGGAQAGLLALDVFGLRMCAED